MTGIDIDENTHPEKVEHLGITPLEAMASGCIVFGFKAGGLKEIIIDNTNGYLFSNAEELYTKIEQIILNDELRKQIRSSAFKYVKEQFNYSVFTKRVKEIML